MKFAIEEMIYDDNASLVSTTLVGGVFGDLGRALEYLDYLVDKAERDDNPLTVGWSIDYAIVKLEVERVRSRVEIGRWA